MVKVKKMSDAERQIMELIWDYGKSVTSAEIKNMISELEGAESEWKITTILTFLKRLCGKGVLKTEREGRVNHFTPLMTREEYVRMETQDFVKTVHSGSMKSFLSALCDEEIDSDIDKSKLEELKKWVDEL